MDTLSHFSATTRGCKEGERLSEYLDRFFPYQQDRDWSSRVTQLRIDGAPVSVNDNPILHNNLDIQFALSGYQEDPVASDWHMLWQNDDLFAVHKPAPLPMHRTTRHILNTLTALVRRDSGFALAQPLHRLDQETAGIVLFAKDPQATERWQSQLRSILQAKRYRAIVYGQPSWLEQSLTTSLATIPQSPIRCQMHVVAEGESGAKVSTTEFKVVRCADGYSEIECLLVTGRKHQIRAHLAYLGHPIVGDKIYSRGGEYYLKRLANQITQADREKLQADHHLLMAYQAELSLPGKETITLTDETRPIAWQQFCERVF